MKGPASSALRTPSVRPASLAVPEVRCRSLSASVQNARMNARKGESPFMDVLATPSARNVNLVAPARGLLRVMLLLTMLARRDAAWGKEPTGSCVVLPMPSVRPARMLVLSATPAPTAGMSARINARVFDCLGCMDLFLVWFGLISISWLELYSRCWLLGKLRSDRICGCGVDMYMQCILLSASTYSRPMHHVEWRFYHG